MYVQTSATEKILRLQNRLRVIQGGTSASKTISILLVLIGYAQSDKTPTVTSIVSESFPHLKRGVLRDFKNIMQTHHYWRQEQWNSTDSIYTFETGSQIEFFSADQPDKMRGARRDRLFINECNNVHFDAFEQLEVRTREFVYLDFNPSSEFWLHEHVIGKRDDLDHIIVTYLDNEALDAHTIASIEQRKNRPEWWKVYGEGQLGEIEGRIFTGWQEIDDIPHEARLKSIGLDFGYTADPTAAIAIYDYNGGYIFDELLYRKGMGNKAIADALMAAHEHALIIADSAEPKSIDEIKSYGLNIIGSNKGPGSVMQGIQHIQDTPCSVTKRSLNLLKEYRNYLFIRDRNGKVINKPQDFDNHAIDAVRYGTNTARKGALIA